MTLDEWTVFEMRMICSFREFWHNSQKNGKERFPDNQPSHKWLHDFNAWAGREDE